MSLPVGCRRREPVVVHQVAEPVLMPSALRPLQWEHCHVRQSRSGHQAAVLFKLTDSPPPLALEVSPVLPTYRCRAA